MTLKDNDATIFNLLTRYGTNGNRQIVYASTFNDTQINRFGIPSLNLAFHLRTDDCTGDAVVQESAFKAVFPSAIRVCAIEQP